MIFLKKLEVRMFNTVNDVGNYFYFNFQCGNPVNVKYLRVSLTEHKNKFMYNVCLFYFTK